VASCELDEDVIREIRPIHEEAQKKK